MSTNTTGFDTTRIVELMGAYHRTNYPQIVEKYQASRSLESIFPTLSMVRDELVVTETVANEIMQPYQSGWTPKGSLSFKPETLKVRYAKADISIDPNVFRATYLAEFLQQAPSEEHELVRLAYNKYTERAAKDSAKACIKGKYVEPTIGTAGTAMDTVDGYLSFILQRLTSGDIIATKTGSITDATIIDQVDNIYHDIPEDVREADLRCYMSVAMREKYFRAYRDQFGINTDYTGWNGMVDGSECPIVALPFLGASQRICFSVHGNFRQLALQPSDLFRFEIQKDKRLLNYMMDWSLGFGAMIVGAGDGNKDNQYIWCNDVDAPSQVPAEENL